MDSVIPDPNFTEAVETALGEKLEWLAEFRVGNGRKVYRCQSGRGSLIVKQDTSEMITYVALAGRHLAAAGVPIPEIVALDRMGDHPFVAMMELRGPDLGTLIGQGNDASDALQHLGEIIAAMQSITFESPGWFDVKAFPELAVCGRERLEEYRREPWGLVDLVQDGLLRPEVADNLRSHLADNQDLFERPRPVFVHGDLSTEHIFLSDDGRKIEGIIDFGDMRSDDATWDFVWFWLHERDSLPRLLEGYESRLPLPDDFERKLQVFGLMRLIGEAAWLHQQGFNLHGRIERLENFRTRSR